MNTAAQATPLHPEQERHAAYRHYMQQRELRRRERTKALTETHNLRFIHLRPMNHAATEPLHKGGCTIAYRPGHRVVHVSLALVHEKDSYNKRTGRFYAASAWDEGNTIPVRIPKDAESTPRFLKEMFGRMV